LKTAYLKKNAYICKRFIAVFCHRVNFRRRATTSRAQPSFSNMGHSDAAETGSIYPHLSTN